LFAQLSGLLVQENLQVGSQPEPATLLAVPQSQSSPVSSLPLPQVETTHTPPVHFPLFPAPHTVLSGSDGPTTHFCPLSPVTTTGVQVLGPAQLSVG
jgi:hypothetical protein